MTEEELIATLEALEKAGQESYRAKISIAGYHQYIKAMDAVINRYRMTNPDKDVPAEATRLRRVSPEYS